MKKMLAIVLGIAMILSLAACGSSGEAQEAAAPETEEVSAAEEAVEETEAAVEEETPAAENAEEAADEGVSGIEGKRIGITVPDFSAPFWGRFMEAIQAVADEKGIIVDFQDSASDLNTQISQVQNFITTGVDMVVLMPISQDGCIPVAKELNEAGIPFITSDRTLTSGDDPKDLGIDLITHVGCDDYEGGRKMGELATMLLGDSGKIAVITGKIGSSTQVNRSQGLADYLEESGSNIEIVAEEDCEWDESKAMTITENLLTRFAPGELDAILCQDGFGTVGATEVIVSQGREDLIGKTIAFFCAPELYEQIKAGDAYGAVVQSPTILGEATINTCIEYLENGRDNIPETVYYDLPLMTKDNYETIKNYW